MNRIFLIIVLSAVLFAGWNQFSFQPAAGLPSPMEALSTAMVESATGAVDLAIGLVGVMTLFLGLMKVAEAGGMLVILARLIRPLMVRLFPEVPADHPAMGAMILNLSANALGLGNAATPFGIRAMQELDRLNTQPGTATNAMALFLAVNTSSVTLLPTGVIALRAAIFYETVNLDRCNQTEFISMNIKERANSYKEQVIATRRELHRIPELGFKEEKTSTYVADYLKNEGLRIVTGIARTGVMATLETGRPGPTLLVRADMDALPIHEETGLPFASGHPGVMHACGHDGHTAMALVTATVMNQIKDRISGTIKFVFQPAEEGPGGAKPMIEAGVMDEPHVDFVLCCHIWPDIPEGTIGIRAGALMAAMFSFDITIKGRGGHGALPHQCVDALDVGCQVVAALQRIVSRQMNPLRPTVVTVGRFRAGTAFNVIPETARLSGTARTFDLDTWRRWPDIIETVVKGVCESMGAGYEATFEQGYPPTINDAGMAERMTRVAGDVVGVDRVVVPDATLGGEDMSFFLEKAPGCYFCLGAGNDAYAGIHSPRFDFNEDILVTGVETYCRAALDLLGN